MPNPVKSAINIDLVHKGILSKLSEMNLSGSSLHEILVHLMVNLFAYYLPPLAILIILLKIGYLFYYLFEIV